MQAASITISTRADIKSQTKKIAKQNGFTVSGLVNFLLKQVIGTTEKPTPYLLRSIKIALQQKKMGKSSPRFTSGKDAYKWLER